jgi:hypothetical protein
MFNVQPTTRHPTSPPGTWQLPNISNLLSRTPIPHTPNPNAFIPPVPEIAPISSIAHAIINATHAPGGAHHGGGAGGETEFEPHTGIDFTWVVNPIVTYICFASVAIAVITSVRAVWDHITRYDYPKLQIHIVRILLMIPFYGVLTMSSLLFFDIHFFLDTIRDTYESFVLYTFFVLLVQYAGGEAQLIRSLNAKQYKGIHPVPMQWLPYFRLDYKFYLRCKRWVLQYALIKPIITFLACVGSIFGFYEEANFSPTGLYLYCTIIANISITYSLYYLVLFELETEKELHYCKATWKFICIKSIIFFAFWQSLTVAMLISMGFIYTGPEEISERVTSSIYDFLMCIELAPVSLMHHAAFGRDKLEDEMNEEPQYASDEGGMYAVRQNQGSAKTNLDRALDLSDFVRDTIQTIFYQRKGLVEQENDDEGGGMDDFEGQGAIRREGFGDEGESQLHVNAGEIAYLSAMQRGDVDYGDGMLGVNDEEEDYIPELDNGTTWLNPRGLRSKANNGRTLATSVADAMQEDFLEGEKPAVFCTVCGRFDRPLVKRKSGYKCVECVGTSSRSNLVEIQKEVHAEDNDGSCVVCGRKDRVMVKRGHKMKCVQCLDDH